MKGVALAAATLGGSSCRAALSTSKATTSSSSNQMVMPSTGKDTCPLSHSPRFSPSISSRTTRTSPRKMSTSATATARDGSEGESALFFGGVDNDELALSTSSDVVCRLVALVPPSTSSLVARGEASWLEVMQHEALRLKWADRRLEMRVVEATDGDAFDAAVAFADAVVVVGFEGGSSSSSAVSRLLSRPSVSSVRTVVPLGSFSGSGSIPASWRVNGIRVPTKPDEGKPLLARLPAFFTPFSLGDARRACSSYETARSFWSRAHSDDALTALLVLADATGKVRDPPLSALDSLKGQGLGTLLCMFQNCRKQVIDCVTDEACKAGLDCLTEAPPGDQVAAYRCIVSHESKLFEDFSLCVLTKHRCLGVSAEPPLFPRPRPQAAFRGNKLTHEKAEELFIGWRDASSERFSWRVVAGQNPAYDQFNCQYQVFYRGKARNSFWYVPVFTVETLATSKQPPKRVWRKRKYRVTRANEPGQFRFSVLDNGVVSEENWTIVDVPDDLGFALFSYNGAASAAGQSYSGSVLCTRDGEWPHPKHQKRLEVALKEAGVKTWELFRVKNEGCEGAPLDIDE